MNPYWYLSQKFCCEKRHEAIKKKKEKERKNKIKKREKEKKKKEKDENKDRPCSHKKFQKCQWREWYLLMSIVELH